MMPEYDLQQNDVLTNKTLSISYWCEMSLKYLQMGEHFWEYGLFKPCISNSNMAIRSILKAVYTYENGIHPPALVTLTELIGCARKLRSFDLSSELFIHKVCLLASDYESILVRPPVLEDLLKLMQKIRDLVSRVSLALNVG
ncbi:HEPN domain-containing protein [Paenibacillus eucommiae]|uniref:HEPN domain-containing protein n=1 Tax=Paenibacillus eucommiae TaxID=1355755 RepID=A0ABS4IWC6_9BACL|nr:HEPN domain-containing protein [Paenibacillus eucommiae]MBP1991813.1 HEPN domain-containing protein [Paenibacillus eucommiae]